MCHSLPNSNGDDSWQITEVDGFLRNVKCVNLEELELVYKCTHSDDIYYSASYVQNELFPVNEYNDTCSNDPYFYQACKFDAIAEVINGDKKTVCGVFICSEVIPGQIGYIVTHVDNIYQSGYVCEDIQECVNTNFGDNIGCENEGTEMVYLPSGKQTYAFDLCNDRCDMHSCEDEADCNGYQYGTYCPILYSHNKRKKYLRPTLTCNAIKNCPSKYDSNCVVSNDTQSSCISSSALGYVLHKVLLQDHFRCATMKHFEPYCYNFLDQTNCSDPLKVGLFCEIEGYNSSISTQKICLGDPLCDDHIDTNCVQTASACFVHKHSLCDFKEDCTDKSDEKTFRCSNSTLTVETCTRRLLKTTGNLPIPLAWLKDGEIDCTDGKDEEKDWPSCGQGQTFRYVRDTSSCENVYLCSSGRVDFIEFAQLCDGIETCGNELQVCKLARLSIEIPSLISLTSPDGLNRHLSYCVRGLSNMEYLKDKCVSDYFHANKTLDVFGQTAIHIYIPSKARDCDSLFGENYVLTSCSKKCINSSCPIQSFGSRDQCSKQLNSKVFTIANNKHLTFLRKRQAAYIMDYFACKNNNKCLEFEQVCNLVDDCGDDSDEIMCTNHFQCTDTGFYIPITNKCDGTINCSNLSDECNEDCSVKILKNWILVVLSWAMGVIAVSANFWVIVKSIVFVKTCNKSMVFVNRCLIAIISYADLLVGVYLLFISTFDTIIHKDNYCSQQNIWLTSTFCQVLGVISSMGSQISLLAMTGLSMTRVKGVYSVMKPQGDVTSELKLKMILTGALLCSVATFISVFPLINRFEDYFVNGLTYDAEMRIFIGRVNKETHFAGLQGFYGRMKHQTLSWHMINKMVDGMFSHDFDYTNVTETRRKVTFYGNDGVCLFKYFVKNTDPQRHFVWTILGIDMLCFLMIAVCYICIGVITARSSHAVNVHKNDAASKRRRRINRKITIIICTDFICWVPFIVICVLHSCEVLDATFLYSIFSIGILPINSMINPLLYDDTITKYLKLQTLKSLFVSGTSIVRNLWRRWRNNHVHFTRDPATNDLVITAEHAAEEIVEMTNIGPTNYDLSTTDPTTNDLVTTAEHAAEEIVEMRNIGPARDPAPTDPATNDLVITSEHAAEEIVEIRNIGPANDPTPPEITDSI